MENYLGNIIARILSGCWRSNNEESGADISEFELVNTLEILTTTGAGALAFQQLMKTNSLPGSSNEDTLRDKARQTAIHSITKATELNAVCRLLNQAGIRFLLFKGWAVAQSYSRPECRPIGDLDIVIDPDKEEKLRAIFASAMDQSLVGFKQGDTNVVALKIDSNLPEAIANVDLHCDLNKFRLGPVSEIFHRAKTVKLGNSTVTIPCQEDHLRLLCLHFLRHGGQRPLWLCDVAAVLEGRDDDFCWNSCLGSDLVTQNWITTVLLLANKLLGARLDGLPDKVTSATLPKWIPEQVLLSWAQPMVHYNDSLQSRFVRMKSSKSMGAAFKEIRALWPNPVGAVMRTDAVYKKGPQWPYQLRLAVRQARSIVWGRG